MWGVEVDDTWLAAYLDKLAHELRARGVFQLWLLEEIHSQVPQLARPDLKQLQIAAPSTIAGCHPGALQKMPLVSDPVILADRLIIGPSRARN